MWVASSSGISDEKEIEEKYAFYLLAFSLDGNFFYSVAAAFLC